MARPNVVFEPGGVALVCAAIEIAFSPPWTNEQIMELESVMSDVEVTTLVKSTAALRVGCFTS